MSTYTPSQITAYLTRISYPQHKPLPDPNSLADLALLQKHQLASVPFESISLHYSKFHLLSLDPEDLYQKIVVRRRGGYCMENNTFFGTVLRSLGYQVYNAGGRVSNATAGRPGGGYVGWSHMVNIVTMSSQRYLIDVGFGAACAVHPLPLISGHESIGIAPSSMKLEYTRLEKHTDPSQRVWVYSYRASDAADWFEAYSFTELEFFPEDYAVMNLSTMVLPTSYFTQTVLAEKTLLNVDSLEMEGVLILHKDELKKRIHGATEIFEKLKSEEERVKVLDMFFGIVLNEEERKGIRDLASELRG